MQSTLLVGPADWDARRMPKDEFAARIAAFWRRCPTAGGAIVYGGRAHHAELAYLTSFTPKLEAALALIPRAGAPQLMVGGGANMLPAAKPLTWIDDLRPLRNVAATISEWAGRQRGNGRPALIGGPSMPHALRQELAKALGDGIEDKTADLAALMRRKSAHEIAALRAACATLGVAMTAIGDAQRAGAGATAAVLAGERAAHRRGAQDVRTLFSLDGGVSLRPLDTPVERAVDPLQVYIAVRQLGYWAEGFAVVGASPLAGALQAVLHSVLPRVQAGKPCSEVAHAIGEAIRPKGPHPVSARIVGNAVGLALEESPLISAECGARFESGGVYSLRAGACDEQATSAIVSAMVLVKDDGNELLWPHAAAVK
jgi:Xaa-Pro aminopeptidase